MPYNYSQKTMDRLLDYGDELQGRLPRSFVKKYSERAAPDTEQHAVFRGDPERWQLSRDELTQTLPYHHDPEAAPADPNAYVQLLKDGTHAPKHVAPQSPPGLLDDAAAKIRDGVDGNVAPNAPQHGSRVAGDITKDPYFFVRQSEPEERIDVSPRQNEIQFGYGDFTVDTALPSDIEKLKFKAPDLVKIINGSKRISLEPNADRQKAVAPFLAVHAEASFPGDNRRADQVTRQTTNAIDRAIDMRDSKSRMAEGNPSSNHDGYDIGTRVEYNTRVGISGHGVEHNIPSPLQGQGADRAGHLDTRDMVAKTSELFATVIAAAPISHKVGGPSIGEYEAHIATYAPRYAQIARQTQRPVFVVIDRKNFRVFNP